MFTFYFYNTCLLKILYSKPGEIQKNMLNGQLLSKKKMQLVYLNVLLSVFIYVGYAKISGGKLFGKCVILNMYFGFKKRTKTM